MMMGMMMMMEAARLIIAKLLQQLIWLKQIELPGVGDRIARSGQWERELRSVLSSLTLPLHKIRNGHK